MNVHSLAGYMGVLKMKPSMHFLSTCALIGAFVLTPSSYAQSDSAASPPSSASGDSASSSMGQASVTPSYELGGIGQARPWGQPGILTAPVYGLPVRMDNGVFIYPDVYVGAGNNSNVVGTRDNAISSSVVTLQPYVAAELKNHGDRYTLSYRGNFTRYDSSSADNFNHHDIQLAGDNYFTSRSSLGWGAGYIERTDPRGSTDRAISAEPDKWHSPIARALYGYGTPGAQGRFEVEGSYQQKRYDNNRAFTTESDADLSTVAGRFFYRVMPRTSAVMEVRQTYADYIADTSTNDNTDRRYLVGLTWEATAKTTGTFKVGQLEKKFPNAARVGGTSGTWEGAIRWSPMTYSVWDLITSKAAADSTGFGDYITNTGATVLWNHQWASTISSRVTLGVVQSDFSATPRTDITRNYGLGFFYNIARTVRAGLELSRTDRSSNISIYEFNRNVSMLSLEVTL